MLPQKLERSQAKAIFSLEPFSLLSQSSFSMATIWLCKTNTASVAYRGWCLCYSVETWCGSDDLTWASIISVSLLVTPLPTPFFIILNFNQTHNSTAETETALYVVQEKAFFCRSVHCSVLLTFPLTNSWSNVFKKHPRGLKKQTAGADLYSTASLKWWYKL